MGWANILICYHARCRVHKDVPAPAARAVRGILQISLLKGFRIVMLSHLGLREIREKTEGVLVDRRWRGEFPWPLWG